MSTDKNTVMQQALEVLVNVARDLAIEQINELKRSLGTRLPYRQAMAQRDLEQIDSVIAQLMNALSQSATPCEMGAICIGCTPRVDGQCPGRNTSPE